ncbi:MAG: ATP synthase F1 subunit delta [Flavobacteriales bacterium]
MKGTKAAPRYAKSLLMLAIEQKMDERAYTDMLLMKKTCDQNEDLRILLRSPVIKGDKKTSILTALFPSLSPIVSGFIKIITQHRRENMLYEIAGSYIAQYKEHKKIVVAEVISAVKISDNARKKISETLHKSQGKEIEIVERIDKDIIGGLIVRVGDRQFDGSIMRKLNDLRKQFSDNPYIPEF